MTTSIRYRPADPTDAVPIGRLHADSWQRHYRGAYSDAYLDGEARAERVARWTELLGAADADRHTIVAELDGEVVGFAHLRLDADPDWGALLDNLHVSHALKRRGVGRALMAETARVVVERRPRCGLYLWVLRQNTAAQAFYRAQGGACVEATVRGPLPGGGSAPSLRFAWADPTVLVGT